MNELEIAVSVLAVVALPLAGIGPMLLRTLRPSVAGACMVACAVIVLVLTRAPWAAAFTACVGAAVLLRHHRKNRPAAPPALPSPEARRRRAAG